MGNQAKDVQQLVDVVRWIAGLIPEDNAQRSDIQAACRAALAKLGG